MYPETDIPPSLITSELLNNVRSNLPEPADKKRERLIREYSLNAKLATQIADSEYSVLFEVIAKESGVTATIVAAFLTETLKALKRDGVQVEQVSEEQLREIFRGVGSGELAKEAISDVFDWLSKHEDKSLHDAMDTLALRMFSKAELETLVDRVVAANRQSVEKLGKNAYGMLMGTVMKEVRGKADPKLVGELLKERLR
jgi:glutamyl-tRNA(Gln) amidotransferase subunit E